MSKCFTCNKRKAGGIECDQTFVRGRLTFHVSFKSGLICRKCAEKEVWKKFEDYGGRLIRKISGGRGFLVDWKYFAECESPDVLDACIDILASLGVLDLRMKGNWVIFNHLYSICWLPCKTFFYYFRDRTDAVGYAKAKCGKTQLHYVIAHIDEVL